MSNKSSPFDSDEFSRIFAHFEAQNRHPNGPWAKMTGMIEKVVENNNSSSCGILDLASGPGEPAATFARRFPKAQVYATDSSDAMYQQALKLAADLPNLKAMHVDMQDMKVFADNEFDIVTCSYGFMFPPDIDKALSESYRVLRPGGTLIATTWNYVSHYEIFSKLMRDVYGNRPVPPPPADPLSLAEPGKFEKLVQNAGFQNITTDNSTYPFDFTNDPEFQFRCIIFAVRDKLDELDAWDQARASFQKLAARYVDESTGHMITTKNEFMCLVATKPT